MSILGGFDAVIELGVDVITKKIRDVSIGGANLNTPTELQFGDTSNGADFIILDPIGISLSVGDNGISATISFDESTIYYNGTIVRPLKGVVTIQGQIVAAPVNPSDATSTTDIFFELPGNAVAVTWDAGSLTQGALGALKPSDRSAMEAQLKTLVWLAITENRPRANLNFNLDNTRDGLLGKFGLRFRSVLVQNIDANTIGVFCTVLLATSAPSTPARTEAGLVGKTGVAMSVSQPVFQKLVFCPSIAEKLLTPWNPQTQTADDFLASVTQNVPSQCGNGDFIKLSGYNIPLLGSASLKKISTAFQNGSVLIEGTIVAGVASNDYCWRIAVDFNSNADLSVVNGAVQIKLNPDPPNTSSYVDVNWYCAPLYVVALAVAAAPTAGIILGSPYVDGITSMLVSKLVNKPLNLNQTEQVGFDDFVLLGVTVKPDRLTLDGLVSSAQPPAAEVRGVTLAITGENPIDNVPVGSGTYQFPGSMTCKANNYSYVEYAQEDVITLTADETLMGSAPTTTWTMEGHPLTGTSGTVAVSVPATIPQPGDFPGKDTISLGIQTTTVDYQIVNPTTVVLTGHGAFDYAVNVATKCTTLEGFVSTDNLFALFTNRVMQMSDAYYKDMAACALASKLRVGKLGFRQQQVPLGGDPPNYGQTVQILGEAIARNQVGALETLAAVSQAYGNQIYGDVLNAMATSE